MYTYIYVYIHICIHTYINALDLDKAFVLLYPHTSHNVDITENCPEKYYG